MKKYFTIFVILSTFAVPASGEEIKIKKHQNSSIQVQYTLDEFCDSDGYVEKINGTHIGSNGYVPSLGEIELQCKSTGNGIVTVRCYKYKKLNDTVRKKIRDAFKHHCDPNKKKTSQVNIENNLTRPDSHLSQAELCTNTNGEWTNNKCTCKPQNGTYYKFDQVGGCYIEDDYRTKRESKKAEQKTKTEQQKKEKEAKKAEQKAKKALDKQAKSEEKEAKAAKQEQMAKDCNTAGGKIIAGKCKCNDNKKIYDPETITCISKTANYDAALNILNTLNNTLDTTMAKFNKPQG